MRRFIACFVPAALLATALPARAAELSEIIASTPAWSAWLGGASALLLIVSLALAVGRTAHEPRYEKPRRPMTMPLRDPGAAS